MTDEQNEMLDYLLTDLRTRDKQDDNEEIKWTYRKTKLIEQLGLTREIVSILYDVLVQDNFATKDERGTYFITPKGRLFNINEGYVIKAQTLKRQQFRQGLQAWTIAAATVVALLYFLLELQKYHSDCLCK